MSVESVFDEIATEKRTIDQAFAAEPPGPADRAFAYLAMSHAIQGATARPPEDGWKPKDRRRNLVIAAAFIVAEIERLDRTDGR